MEPNLETICGGRFLNGVAYSNYKKQQVKIRSMKMRRPVNFGKCVKWVWLWSNIMDYKLENVWSGCLLNDVAYINSETNEHL